MIDMAIAFVIGSGVFCGGILFGWRLMGSMLGIYSRQNARLSEALKQAQDRVMARDYGEYVAMRTDEVHSEPTPPRTDEVEARIAMASGTTNE